MDTFGSRFKQERKKLGLSQDELAKKFYTTKSSISRYENDKQVPEIENLQKYASYFNVTVDYLLNGDTKTPSNLDSEKEFEIIPVLGTISAGQPMFAEENIIEYRKISADQVKNGQYFYLKVKGDSMIGSRIFEGDHVLVRKQEDVENGSIAVVMVNKEEATLKRVYKTDGTVILQPDNPKYKPTVLSSGELRIVGKVVRLEVDF